MGLWESFDCPESQRRWRRLEDGRIEVEGLGVPQRGWPSAVNDWAAIIEEKAAKYQVPAYWIAAIMALESGGKPGLCRKKADGTCSLREGIGLMAMLVSTATKYAGRSVEPEELLRDHDLQIDLGAKMIADLGSKYRGDYVKVAVAYNAGSVKCREGTSGNTWNLPKEPCPQTPWGVLMGCLRTAKPINELCAPSELRPDRFVCPVNYPEIAIGTHNAAIAAGWDTVGLGVPPDLGPAPEPAPGPVPLPDQTPPAQAALGIAGLFPLAAAAVVGFYGFEWARNRWR